MVTDRTGDFLSLCIRCRLQQQQERGRSSSSNTAAASFSSASASACLFDTVLPSPPFSFAPAAAAAAADAAAAPAPAAAAGSPSSAATSEASVAAVLRRYFPVPANTFAFLLLAARCAEAQHAIAQQLHPLLAAESTRGSRKEEPRGREALLSEAAEEVSRLLQGVRQQQKQLQHLEKQTRVWSGVDQLAKARQQWEHAESTRRRSLGATRSRGFFWRSTTAASAADGAALGRKGGAADWEESAALAHRRAVVGCLYGSLQALTEELKKKEVSILQAQVEKERYFSAYGLLHSLATVQEGRDEARQGKEATKQQPQSAAWMRMQSSLAAAAAARAAEQLLAAPQLVEGRSDIAKERGRAAAATGGRGGDAAAADEGCVSDAAAASGLRSVQVALRHRSTAARGGSEASHPQQQLQAPNTSDSIEGSGSSTACAKRRGLPFSSGGGSSEAAAKRFPVSSSGRTSQTASACAFEEEQAAAAGDAGEGRAQVEEQLLLLLQEEEQQLVNSFAQESDVVLDVQRKLQEIVQCMDIFSSKVLEQSAACDYIQELADISVEHVAAAEKHLKVSLERSAAYRYYVFLFFIGAGLILLLLDFLKASSPYL